MTWQRAASSSVLLLALTALPSAPISGKTQHTVGQYAYPRLIAAQELMAAERYEEALEILESLLEKRINPHERALALQSMGFIQSSQEQWAPAIDSLEKCLELEALPDGSQAKTRYNIAQLYLVSERYREAADTLEVWFRQTEKPGPAAYYLLATAYALDSRFDFAIPVAEKTVELSKAPKESWLQLLVSLYLQEREFEKLVGVLEQLSARFPKKMYWMQLAAVYGELGRDEESLGVLQLAYEEDMLTRDEELRRLAQLYLFYAIPWRAARVVEQGLEQGVIEDDAAAWELLANSLIRAREYEDALEPLDRAARLSNDGQLFVRLGQLHIEREEWAEAERVLRRALERDLAKPGQAWLLLGVARYSAKRPGPARHAFAQARSFEDTRKAALTWLGHIQRDVAARSK